MTTDNVAGNGWAMHLLCLKAKTAMGHRGARRNLQEDPIPHIFPARSQRVGSMKIKLKPVTEEERKTWPKDVVVALEKAHVDVRGEIQPLVDLPMESCVLISSAKGSVRANHYHQTDWHFCYVLAGSIVYYHRPHGSDAK